MIASPEVDGMLHISTQKGCDCQKLIVFFTFQRKSDAFNFPLCTANEYSFIYSTYTLCEPCINPAFAGVSGQSPLAGGGGGRNSRTIGRSETSEAAIESSSTRRF